MKNKYLYYNGIIFDEWAEGDDGEGNDTYWANICPNCAAAAKCTTQLDNVIDFQSNSAAACSVKGCNYSGEKNDIGTHYIDFDPKFVEIK